MTPTLEKVTVNDKALALHELETFWVLPDRSEVCDKYAFNRFRKQLNEGYFYRLVWPAGTTEQNVLDWFDQVDKILEWRRLGVV